MNKTNNWSIIVIILIIAYVLWGKKNPKTKEDLIKEYTIDNYFTIREIEYRKKDIEKLDYQVSDILQSVREYRNSHKKVLLNLVGETLYTIDPNSKLIAFVSLYKLYIKENSILPDMNNMDYYILEAFSSATIEGANTTLARSKKLVKEKQKPKNDSEKMVLNTYNAMEFIQDKIDKPLTNKLIQDIHKIVTQGTLDNPHDEGKYRTEPVEIKNRAGKSIFKPVSNIKIMQKMLNTLLNWVNSIDDEPENNFEKALVFHFAFAHIHPFIDGNGRTSRILQKFLLLKYGLNYIAYLPIVDQINKNRDKYYKTFTDIERITPKEANNFDVTYFINYAIDMYMQLIIEMVQTANNELQPKIKLKLFENIQKNNIKLTPRQLTILDIVTKEPATVQIIAKKLGFSDSIIRQEIKYLVEINLISKINIPNIGKGNYYTVNIKL